MSQSGDDDSSADDVGFSGAEYPDWLTSGCLPLLVIALAALAVFLFRP